MSTVSLDYCLGRMTKYVQDRLKTKIFVRRCANDDELQIEFRGIGKVIVSRKEWEAKRLIPGAAIEYKKASPASMMDTHIEVDPIGALGRLAEQKRILDQTPINDADKSEIMGRLELMAGLGDGAIDQWSKEIMEIAKRWNVPPIELRGKSGAYKTGFAIGYGSGRVQEEARDTHIKPAVWCDDVCDNGGAITDCGGTITMPPPLKWYQKLLRYRLRNPLYMADE